MPLAGIGWTPFLFARRIGREQLPADSQIHELAQYWSDHRTGARLPSRADIDPLTLPRPLLQWIFLMDVLRSQHRLDYRYRLVGTANAQLVGRDATGRLASEIFSSTDRAFMLSTFDVTVLQAEPTYWHAAVPQDKFERIEVYRGLFPLASDGKTVDMLICAAIPDPVE
jgi:hypothetical protein